MTNGKSRFSVEGLRKKLASEPEEPSGCVACGAIAGCCDKYPNCPGNPNFNPRSNDDGDSSKNET